MKPMLCMYVLSWVSHCSPISDQGTWSCGCSVVFSISWYFHWIAISIDSDAQIETAYRTWTSLILCTFNVPLHTRVQDGTVAVWDFISPVDIILRMVLKGHTVSVYAVDFDEKYIVSGSWDRTIKVGTEVGRDERDERDERERSLC